MSKTGYGQGGGVGVLRAVTLLRRLLRHRKALSFIFAALLLLNAAVPYWHAGQKLQAWTSAYAAPEARHESLPSAALECHQPDGAAPQQQDGNRAPTDKRPCPLCQALQLFSPGTAPPAITFIPCAPHAVAALLPRPPEQKTPAYKAEQAQPRAPPSA
jgi:hypothetical protein